uniref:Uncharacterized protein n=1 Tax=Ciona intestinalis TaxID=7719 RepID=H2Y3S6_CIOIN
MISSALNSSLSCIDIGQVGYYGELHLEHNLITQDRVYIVNVKLCKHQ